MIRRTTGVPPLDYGLVARWLAHMHHGQFAHASIASAAPVPHEKELGRVAHYSIGMSLAALLLMVHPGWADRPTLGPALATGLGSTALVMQPAFGMGVAASKTPDPAIARLRGLRTPRDLRPRPLPLGSDTGANPASSLTGGEANGQ